MCASGHYLVVILLSALLKYLEKKKRKRNEASHAEYGTSNWFWKISGGGGDCEQGKLQAVSM